MEYEWTDYGIHPLVVKRGWLENPLSMEVLGGKSSINGGCSIAMFDYQRETRALTTWGSSWGYTWL